ncbi:MAG TPA: peptidoglycan bridge formation glycyltransferase FemA/FemB family protein [Candidatus Nanopelagicaceae bacterium]|nr:peptidoglycan bridge formation glycyltransferase FemA/FemB family protein [Candidatus Nanopelagicaceae bacterium]
MSLRITPISRDQHLAFIQSLPSASFLQTPAWAMVKAEWRSESIGWFDGDNQVGAALLLLRQLPRIPKWFAYIPEGPLLNWQGATQEIAEALHLLVEYARTEGVFLLRIGPPVAQHTWSAATMKTALATEETTALTSLEPDETNNLAIALCDSLKSSGWRAPRNEDGFGLGQPQFVYQLPLAGKNREDLLSGFNQLWRRNLKRADKEEVAIELGSREDLQTFHDLYLETAKRDQFIPRPLIYFQNMWDAMRSEESDRLSLYLAKWQGSAIASTIMIRVGDHAWYSYGASSAHGREARGSNAIQWRMIQDALDAGASIYDLRGITSTLDPTDPHAGLLQFKLGVGGQAIEYVGEWDYRISPLFSFLFTLLLRLRK